MDVGLVKKDAEFASYLRNKGYHPNRGLNLEKLRKEFDSYGESPAQE